MTSIFNRLTGKLCVIRLTASGRGAIATILLHGPGASDVFGRHWIGPALRRDFPVFGRFRLRNSELHEEVVVHEIGAEEIEIHSHGGDLVVSAIESALIDEGAVSTSWTDFYCPGDSERDRAWRLLPHAPTERAAQILLDQYHGALERELEEIKMLNDPTERENRLARLRENARIGKHLVEPFRIVLAGGTNAGKSSLFNAILGFRRVIVDAAPGTTRDSVSAVTSLKGFPFEFFDTAGFRETSHDLERQGIERTRQLLDRADLILWVVDSTIPNEHQPSFPKSDNILFCRNKIDLPTGDSQFNCDVDLCATTGEGVEELLCRIVDRLIPDPPRPLEAVPLGEFP